MRTRAVLLVAALLVASCDGAPRLTTTPEVFLRNLKPTLDPKSPGPAELPGDLLPMPFPWVLWTVVGAVALAAGTLALRRALRKPAAAATPAPAEPPTPADEIALRRIAELRARPPSAADVGPWHVEASEVVRDYVGARFDVPATRMTSEELAAATSAPHRASLAGVLARCDAVKFARDEPDADEALRLLDSAESFVKATRKGGAA